MITSNKVLKITGRIAKAFPVRNTKTRRLARRALRMGATYILRTGNQKMSRDWFRAARAT